MVWVLNLKKSGVQVDLHSSMLLGGRFLLWGCMLEVSFPSKLEVYHKHTFYFFYSYYKHNFSEVKYLFSMMSDGG